MDRRSFLWVSAPLGALTALGHVRYTLARGRLLADFRAVSAVTQRTATVATTASFTIEDGRPGALRA